MSPDHPLRSVEKDEVELREHLVRAEPDITVAALVDMGEELAAEMPAN